MDSRKDAGPRITGEAHVGSAAARASEGEAMRRMTPLTYESSRHGSTIAHEIRCRLFAVLAILPWMWIDCSRPMAMNVTSTEEPP